MGGIEIVIGDCSCSGFVEGIWCRWVSGCWDKARRAMIAMDAPGLMTGPPIGRLLGVPESPN